MIRIVLWAIFITFDLGKGHSCRIEGDIRARLQFKTKSNIQNLTGYAINKVNAPEIDIVCIDLQGS